MPRFDQIIALAVEQLDKRGLLLDRQLSLWTEGDDHLLREVRDCLIAAEVAEDRFRMGLARVVSPGDCRLALLAGRLKSVSQHQTSPAPVESLTSDPDGSDWWVMTNGTIRGPWTIDHVRTMFHHHELSTSDLLRKGPRGAWLKPHEVAAMVDPAWMVINSEHVEPSAGTEADSGSQSDSADGLVQHPLGADAPAENSSTHLTGPTSIPPPIADDEATEEASLSPSLRRLTQERWKIDLMTNLFPTVWAVFRHFDWHIVHSWRGSRILLIAMTLLGLLVVWQNWPPTSRTIIREFEDIHLHIQTLKATRRADSQLQKDMAADRQRIQRRMDLLQRRVSRREPIHSELLMVGQRALLPMLDQPRNFDSFENLYQHHMRRAKGFLDGLSPDKSGPPGT